MITITNGRETLVVTAGAFRDIFKAQGFHDISEIPKNILKNVAIDAESQGGIISRPSDKNVYSDVSEPLQDVYTAKTEQPKSRKEELAEIPLNEMTPDELREYAKILGVDIRGLKSKSAVKDKIRSVL